MSWRIKVTGSFDNSFIKVIDLYEKAHIKASIVNVLEGYFSFENYILRVELNEQERWILDRPYDSKIYYYKTGFKKIYFTIGFDQCLWLLYYGNLHAFHRGHFAPPRTPTPAKSSSNVDRRLSNPIFFR